MFFDNHFTEVDALYHGSGWDMEFRQLSAGALQGRVRILASSNCTAMRVDLNQVHHQRGQAPADQFTIGLPFPSSGDFTWGGAPVRGGSILNFNQSLGFEGTNGRTFSGCTLSFSQEFLESVAASLELRIDLNEIPRRSAILVDGSEQTTGLREHVDGAFRVAAEVGPASEGGAASLPETRLAEMLLRILAGSQETPGSAQPARRYAMKRALEILDNRFRLPITVADLCQEVGVSAPSLHRAFHDEFGVSTKRYIQSRILSAVRTELISAPPDTLVSDIANAWGIWHMGKFAADYRNQFGELPSESLQRAPRGLPLA